MAKNRSHLNTRVEGFRPQARPEMMKEIFALSFGSAVQRHTPKPLKDKARSKAKTQIKREMQSY